jgi:transcriptional regulator with XRE-family HTH domain
MIAIEDLIKYGLARDVEPARKQSLEERGAMYSRRISLLERQTDRQIAALEQAGMGSPDKKKIKALSDAFGKEYSKIEKERDAAFDRINQRYDSELASYERLLQRPDTIRQVSSLRSAEQQKEIDRIRGETEVVQREAAEREAGRLRARGGRGSRQMLASARLSPQGMGVGGESTLGAAPF